MCHAAPLPARHARSPRARSSLACPSVTNTSAPTRRRRQGRAVRAEGGGSRWQALRRSCCARSSSPWRPRPPRNSSPSAGAERTAGVQLRLGLEARSAHQLAGPGRRSRGIGRQGAGGPQAGHGPEDADQARCAQGVHRRAWRHPHGGGATGSARGRTKSTPMSSSPRSSTPTGPGRTGSTPSRAPARGAVSATRGSRSVGGPATRFTCTTW